MLQGWLIYSKKDALENLSYIDWFIHEASLQNINLTLIYREDLHIGIKNQQQIILLQGKRVNLPQFAVVRTIEPLLQRHLEDCGIHVFNSSEVATVCNHKALTYQTVSRLGVPMVDTYFLHQKNITSRAPLAYPFVIKAALSRGGKDVYLIHSDTDWKKCLNELPEQDLIIQTSNVQHGKDVRVFVIGKQIIAAVLRKNSVDFRANFKLGGHAHVYNLQRHEIEMINKIINHFDFDLVGIDFLIGLNGELLFNEIEDVVGSRILSEVSEINLLENYVSHIRKKITKSINAFDILHLK